LASPALTGTPTAPTPVSTDNSTTLATTAFVKGFGYAPIASPAFTGTPTAPTAAADTNTTQLATTAFVIGQAATANPLMDGTVAPGTSLKYARGDHVHPTDTSRAPTASPTFTGTTNISGAWQLSGIISPAAITGNQNNYNPTGLSANTVLRITATAPFNITGLNALSNGNVIALSNIGTNAITLTNLDASSTPANQFNIGANTALGAGQTALLIYDGTASQWRNLAGSGSGGGSAVYVQDTAPTGAIAGSLWWNSTNGQLYLYYNDGNSFQWVFASSAAAPTPPTRGALHGLTYSTAGLSTTFTIAPGQATDSTFYDSITLNSAISKTTAAWAAGSGVGGLDTGSIAASTWYHIFVIKNPTTGAADVVYSLSLTPALPSGFTLYRRICTIRTNASSQWGYVMQNGDEFLWNTWVADYSTVAWSTTAALQALTVPTGFQVNALFNGRADAPTGSGALLFSPPDMADTAPAGGISSIGVNTATASTSVGAFNIRTDTSGRIRVRANTTGPTYSITTYGWIDTRGRFN
jgi:hypothetical protein